MSYWITSPSLVRRGTNGEGLDNQTAAMKVRRRGRWATGRLAGGASNAGWDAGVVDVQISRGTEPRPSHRRETP